MRTCEHCGKPDPDQDYRLATDRAETEMEHYTGFSAPVETDWCSCCDTCHKPIHKYECTCECEHGCTVYEMCPECEYVNA